MRKLRVLFSFALLFILVGFYQNCSQDLLSDLRLKGNGEAYEGFGEPNPDPGNGNNTPGYHIVCAPKTLPNMGLNAKINVHLDGSITSAQIFDSNPAPLKVLSSQNFSGLQLKTPTDLGSEARLRLFQLNDNLDRLQIRVQMIKTAQIIDEQWHCR